MSTLLPPLLVIVGRWVFWPFVPAFSVGAAHGPIGALWWPSTGSGPRSPAVRPSPGLWIGAVPCSARSRSAPPGFRPARPRPTSSPRPLTPWSASSCSPSTSRPGVRARRHLHPHQRRRHRHRRGGHRGRHREVRNLRNSAGCDPRCRRASAPPEPTPRRPPSNVRDRLARISGAARSSAARPPSRSTPPTPSPAKRSCSSRSSSSSCW